ncbi:hypothetical protein SLEP1_g20291 [Rubroshorea leprosula]|uniref:Uncharacterized protein n=1 Tax=Rubroshorea leprosula TaxID=152421 RepID=A0AAV5J267_9ROSI|nr:hypothetical protein SLEP1_g20291 [Rubroshorea leprosula]
MEKIMEEVTSIEGNKNREKRIVQGLPNTHTDCPEHVFQLLDCIFQISAIVSRFPRLSRLVHNLSLGLFIFVHISFRKFQFRFIFKYLEAT